MSANIKETLGMDMSSVEAAEKPKAKRAPTIRLEVTLTQPTADVFPEFSYARLVEKELSARKGSGGGCSDADDAQKISEIARRLEQKYGGVSAKSKKRKRLVYDEDLVDISSGYDETDPFVDNSEAFDDNVPDGYEPQLGGFYINDGELFFKSMSDDEDSRSMHASVDSPDFAPPKKVKNGTKGAEADGEKPGRGRGRGTALTHKSLNKSPIKRPDGTTGNPRGRPRKITAIKLSGPKVPGTVTATTAVSTPVTATTPGSTLSSPTKPTSTTSSADNSVASDGRQPIAQRELAIQSPGSSPEKPVGEDDDEDEAMDTDLPSLEVHKFEHPDSILSEEAIFGDQAPVTELPDGLPSDLAQYMLKFRQDILDGTIETAPVKNLDSTYDSKLLEIETKLHNRIKGKKRQAVYAYLSSFLPHSKESLQRRAKKVNIANEEASLEGPLARLQEAVELQIPEQLERYKEEVRRAVEAHNSKTSVSSADESMTVASDSNIGSGDDDWDSSLINALESPTRKSSDEGKPKKFRPPQKKFLWNPETRALLCDAVQAKVESLRATMQRIVGGMESVKLFLEQRVKPLWPDSWMNVSILYRESRQAHLKITNPVQYKQLHPLPKGPRAPRGPRIGGVHKSSKTCPAVLVSALVRTGASNGTSAETRKTMSVTSPTSASATSGQALVQSPPLVVQPAKLAQSPPAAHVQPSSATRVQSPTATRVQSPTAGRVQSPTATRVQSPTAGRVRSPTATRVQSPTATRVQSPTAGRVQSPTAGRVQSPTATRVQSPTATRVQSPTGRGSPVAKQASSPRRPSAISSQPIQRVNAPKITSPLGRPFHHPAQQLSSAIIPPPPPMLRDAPIGKVVTASAGTANRPKVGATPSATGLRTVGISSKSAVAPGAGKKLLESKQSKANGLQLATQARKPASTVPSKATKIATVPRSKSAASTRIGSPSREGAVPGFATSTPVASVQRASAFQRPPVTGTVLPSHYLPGVTSIDAPVRKPGSGRPRSSPASPIKSVAGAARAVPVAGRSGASGHQPAAAAAGMVSLAQQQQQMHGQATAAPSRMSSPGWQQQQQQQQHHHHGRPPRTGQHQQQ